jgi:transcriptional regulator with XRE-family HTH domain
LRRRAGLSVRELARQAGVSPSLVSQIENGRSRASASTLHTLARLLDVAVDDLVDREARSRADPSRGQVEAFRDPADAWHPSEYANRISVVHPSHRAHLHVAEGIDWERLAATPEANVGFMEITYAPGASSADAGEPRTHQGHEYGYVLAGTVEVTAGEEVFVLQEGESIGFDSRIPHRLRNTGATTFRGIWFVHGEAH